MNQELSELIAQVSENTSVEASAVVALNGLIAQLENVLSAGDIEAVKAKTAELKASAAALAAAIPANTTS